MMAGSDRIRGEDDEPIESQFEGQGEEPLELEPVSDQLALDDDDRLPWLDADDDGYESETGTGRVLGLVLLGLIALATIVGGIWWATHRDPDPALVADGSTLPAPSEAYKQAPNDPGGKTFDGTGNTAFAVSEGQNRPARLGEAPPPAASGATPKPGFELARPPAGPAAPPPGKSLPGNAGGAAMSDAAATSGPAVQVGAYSSRALAEAAWGRLVQQHSALSGQRYRIVEGRADIGTVFRLQATPGDASAAQALCARLKAGGLSCQVK